MNQSGLIRWLLLAVAVVVTFSTLVLALPSETPKLALQGADLVNQAPAVRIKLAGPSTPKAPAPQPEKPEAAPEPEPEPKPEPKPEPEPEPKPKPEPKPEPRPEPKPKPEPKSAPEPETTKDVARAEPEKAVDADAAQDPTEKQAEQENLSQQVELTAGNSAAVDSYLTKLSRHLSRFYEYPRRSRRLGQEGSPVIVFEFSRNGDLVRHSLSQSSSHKLLDEAALAMLKAAEPLPEVPESMKGQTFTYALPVRFSLR